MQWSDSVNQYLPSENEINALQAGYAWPRSRQGVEGSKTLFTDRKWLSSSTPKSFLRIINDLLAFKVIYFNKRCNCVITDEITCSNVLNSEVKWTRKRRHSTWNYKNYAETAIDFVRVVEWEKFLTQIKTSTIVAISQQVRAAILTCVKRCWRWRRRRADVRSTTRCWRRRRTSSAVRRPRNDEPAPEAWTCPRSASQHLADLSITQTHRHTSTRHTVNRYVFYANKTATILLST